MMAVQAARHLDAIKAEKYHVLTQQVKHKGAIWSVRGAHHMECFADDSGQLELAQYTLRCWRQNMMGHG